MPAELKQSKEIPKETNVTLGNEEPRREHWDKGFEFTLSAIGYTVGLGNIWRFPYFCMRNGGGAFIVAYAVIMIIFGLPMYFMEACIGQFSGESPLSMWKICPLFKGTGLCIIVVNVVLAVYYNIILTWIIYYIVMSFGKTVPWRTCDNWWNTAACVELNMHGKGNITFDPPHNTSDMIFDNITANETFSNVTKLVGEQRSASEEFWMYKVLDMSDGIDKLGYVKWDLLLCLLASWIIIFCCLWKGIKTSGKVVYVTATVPYLFLTILLVRGVTLPGSLNGIKFYIIPDWPKLLKLKVWIEAFKAIFYTLGAAWGGVITMASYNKFHHNCFRDSIIVCITCGGTSFFAGFVTFSVIGYMATMTGLPVDGVIAQGPGLVFVAFPEVLGNLPIPSFWAACFFLMLLTVGLDSQMVTVETFISSLVDDFPHYLRKHKTKFVCVVVLACFITGIPMVAKGGIYIFQITDWYIASYAMPFIALTECLVIGYVYGIGRMYYDVSLLLRCKLMVVWAIVWCIISPILIFMLLVLTVTSMTSPTYGEYVYPPWAVAFGWTLALTPLVPVPLVAIWKISRADGTFTNRLISLLRPETDWGPAKGEYRNTYKHNTEGRTWRQRMSLKFPTDRLNELRIHVVHEDVALRSME